MTNANTFDPAEWLTRWREAGGGWTDRDLLRMKSNGDLRALTALASELNRTRHRAVIDHIRATAPECEL